MRAMGAGHAFHETTGNETVMALAAGCESLFALICVLAHLIIKVL
jgi:hypothetical protein